MILWVFLEKKRTKEHNTYAITRALSSSITPALDKKAIFGSIVYSSLAFPNPDSSCTYRIAGGGGGPGGKSPGRGNPTGFPPLPCLRLMCSSNHSMALYTSGTWA